MGSFEEKAKAYKWQLVPDPSLPNVLILGDSISIGYTLYVREMLKGKANALVTAPISKIAWHKAGHKFAGQTELLGKLTNKKTTLTNRVDKSLIGGFVLRVGDIEYNASFKNKLKNIKQEFNKNTNLSIT